MSPSTNDVRFRTSYFSRMLPLILLLAFWMAGCGSPVTPTPPSPTIVAESTPTPEATTSPAATPTSAAVATSPPTPSPTATPTPSLTPSSTPTATSTTTPTPTPNASPLAQARQAMHNGDYPAAIAAFNAFLAEHPDGPDAIDANFELAHAWLAANAPRQAIPILDALAQNDDALARHPEIFWWLGRAYDTIDPQKAADAYLHYAELSPHLQTDAYFAAGDALLAAGDAARANEVYARALDAASGLITEFRAREGLAQTAMLLERPQEAIAQYQAILAQAQAPAYRAEIFYRLGEAQEAADLQEDAWESYQQASQAAPDSWYAYQALIKLVEAGQAVDDRLRARIDIHAGAYLPAINILTQLLTAAPEDAGALHALLARAYEGVGNYAAAAAAWRQVLAHPPDDATRNQAWLGLGRSLWRQGLQEEAREVYLQAAEQSADPDVAATALWWAAVLAGQDNDKWLQAADDFMRLAREFPESDYADQAGFRAGLIHYRLGEYETAQALWQEHAANGNGSWQAAAHFWLGKLLMQTGREDEALTHWQETAQRWSEGEFYGVRARQMLEAAGLAPTPTPTPALGADVGAARAWAAQLAGQDVGVFQQGPPEFERISELHRVGEEDRAHRELESLRRKWEDEPVRLWQLALFAQELGYYDISIRAAARLVALSGQPLTAAPRFVQELIYPLPYYDLVTAAAQAFDLDPSLFYALIRQESLFWAPAVSRVGASGLTQIMPSTGRSAATQLNMTDFTLDDLRRPHISLYLGAYILSQELQRGDGNVFWALAAYNAGPGNASFWWELANGDPDLFAELISFHETQRYVRAITVQANHYRRLYPELRP